MAKEKPENEAYYTPPWPVRSLLKVWQPPVVNGGIWVEPAVGSGNIVRAMNESYPGQDWWGCDINPTGYAARCEHQQLLVETHDFLTLKTDQTSTAAWLRAGTRATLASLVMTNPPFSLAGRFLARSRLLFPNAYIMLLLRLGFLASKERAELWPKYGEPDLYLLSNRPSFTEDGQTDRYDYAWYGFPSDPRSRGNICHLASVSLTERERGFAPL